MADRDTLDESGPDDENLAVARDTAELKRENDLERAERRGMGKGAMLGLGAAVLVVLLGAILLTWWNPFAQRGPVADNTTAVTTLPAETVSPTESLPASTATAASSLTDSPTATAAPGSGRLLALNRWNWVESQRMFSVGGFVDVVESGGTCTLTAASGGLTLVASEPARADVTTTICVVNLTSPDIAPGEWSLTMSYDGPSGTATSETVAVTVP